MYYLLVSFVFMRLRDGHFGTMQTVTVMFVTVFGQTLTKTISYAFNLLFSDDIRIV